MISKLGLSNSSAKMIKENSILIALAGQGKTRGTVAINRISLSTNQSIAAMTFNDDIIPEFVFSNLENRYDEIRAMSSGDGSRGGLNKQLVGNIVIPYTIIEEQRKIGAYFENLDNLITLHRSKQITTKNIENRRKSMNGFNKELEFEEALITALQSNGWENQVIKNPTEEDLIQNWANILFENNREIDRLNDKPLIREEMDELIEQIKNLRTPLALNGFINGKTVSIIRKNPEDTLHYGKEVSLKIYDRMEIAAGQSRYQIVEQPIFKRHDKVLQDRRGDIMLLINGMPVFHIELKKTGIPVSEATNQIMKYAHEGVFTGIFSLVQIFFAMNPEETLYFANPGPDGKFNSDFFFEILIFVFKFL